MLRRRETAADGSSPSQASYDAGQWAKAFPSLVEFLTVSVWDDKSPRATGTVTIMAEDGVWKASIRDRAQGCYAFISGKTPGDLLAGLEKALVGDSLDWRQDKPQGAPKRR